MPASFTCPRCGRVSHSPADAAGQYCGHCYAGRLDPALLTPRVLLESPFWVHTGDSGAVTCWRLDVLARDVPLSWQPDRSLVPFQAIYGRHGALEVSVLAETMARAVMELLPPGTLGHARAWPELRHLYQQASTAGYLTLREQGVPSDAARQLAAMAISPEGVHRALAEWESRRRLAWQREQRLTLMEAGRWLTRDLPAPSAVPDREPPRGDLLPLEPPNERGMDGDAQRIEPEDFGDPVRDIFL
jgi:hypothetical protein